VPYNARKLKAASGGRDCHGQYGWAGMLKFAGPGGRKEHTVRIGVCTRPESLRSLAGPPGGLDYIECPVGDVLCPREGEAAFGSRLAAARAAPEMAA